ncbi:glycoside hydrolase family 15 protein [Streptacidiphilus jiangxiensis]|uniref:Glucoamylase (Glucan-1,4-alpha-glucosidase), GH15 family n=1 Tax=Streptacidiphilus jiangxiensis TaxID=235985 RepID=A0A1H7H8G9_STRJI|nr:glycoside hydrolase family 15 protein [Streptacidiphilus jiangxiensis]SEK46723.1 Glucoamylase (glucan-1,4-alpha-glucosidase), GH15 family [Streptacidiphilus jiangxiensis]
MTNPRPAAGTEQFPLHVLREYALCADGERGILVGPRGDIVWMCAPRWDSPAVFSALIGGGGVFAVTPADTPFVWGGFYEDGTLIWHSRWVTTRQIIECREALALPADPHTARILRRIQAVDGDTEVQVVLDPQADFGRHPVSDLRREGDAWTARCGHLHLRWTGLPDAIERPEGGVRARVAVSAGRHRDLVLEIGDQPLRRKPLDAESQWRETADAWREAVPAITGTVADRDARHAYTVLQGLTSRSGGMVAGATMSLPERAEAGRNYDYRYAWIRDQSYCGQAVAALGPHPLLDDALRFVTTRVLADGPDLKPAYTVAGGPVPDEQPLDLKGYPGGTDKVGNWVTHQFQLDALGETLTLFAAAARHDLLNRDHWRAVETAVAAIRERGHEPDAGIWELDNRRWAHSRLTCVAGLHAIAAHAPAAQRTQWRQLAQHILADTARDCLHPTGRWQRAPDDQRVDSALLIPAIRGAVPAHDPRTRATLVAVMTELSEEGYVYRFRQNAQPLEETEGAFLLCGFVAALALHQQGRTLEANRCFERNRAACGTPGLFAEEYDVTQRQLRGNLPQAFVHALLLESAHRLATPWPEP